MKPQVYAVAPQEDWVIDRFVHEWQSLNSEYSAKSIDTAEVIWVLADWKWRSLQLEQHRAKKVVVSIHHIVPEKFGPTERADFIERDAFVDCYHVYCEPTGRFISALTSKPQWLMPWWVNQQIWRELPHKQTLRRSLGLPEDAYVVGSFQRDTEGHDLRSPKLEKGPDIFCDCVEQLYASQPNLHVVLAGWRRQYVIQRLEAAGIPFSYFERPSFEKVNELYNTLNLYIVSSRVEGGPQAIVECAAARVPIVSTDVGYAPFYLSAKSIFTKETFLRAQPDVAHAYARVRPFFVPSGFGPFNKFFEKIAMVSR